MINKTAFLAHFTLRSILFASVFILPSHALSAENLKKKDFHHHHKVRKIIIYSKSKSIENISVKGKNNTLNTYTIHKTSAATGLPLSLRETPQTVTVITRQLMDDMQINTLDDVMKTTAGVTSLQNDNAGRTTYRARGFDITNYRVDGMQVNGSTGFSGSGSTMNMDLYDNVEGSKNLLS
ncbi:TonB-dependent receptor plug domain-containing protein [Gluconobacter wancherniae]|uniref:TonB-dependent receptor plug domain-containing protein n=1 Tax=Gluconobacter wancherniae TaxID=1307955 RepID=UPI001B8ABBCC|nr:TonB-dependent receptor plug domain-containing protein [Gluconobacter wancherniae]MBS1063795.1 TonB-dependent receptor plug domain-containing protein [Gluconobacter wancherniae]